MSEAGRAIRRSRVGRGVTMTALAADLGYSVPYMSDVERGNRGGFDVMMRVADVVGADRGEITWLWVRDRLGPDVAEAMKAWLLAQEAKP